METTVLSFDLLKCKHHPSEKINNFCLNQSCMEGLCATCICDHTESHVINGSEPKYIELKKLHKDFHSKIYKQVDSLSCMRSELRMIIDKLDRRSLEFEKILRQAKKSVMEQVEKSFAQLFDNFVKEIVIEEKLSGIHSIEQLQNLQTVISRQTSQLLQASQQLNSSNFLNSVIKLDQQILHKSHSLSNEIGWKLRKNQCFESSINYKKELLPEINSAVRKLFTLQFKYPHHKINQGFVHIVPEPCSRPSSTNKRTHSITRNNSTINFAHNPMTITHLRNNPSQINIKPQLFQNSNRNAFNKSQLSLIPRFIDEKNQSRVFGKSRFEGRKSHGINIVSNEDLATSQTSKENNSRWIV